MLLSIMIPTSILENGCPLRQSEEPAILLHG
jgi:hypothetical protein